MHGDPSFLFPNLSSYNTNNQLAKFEKNPSVGSIQWNDLNTGFAVLYFNSKPTSLKEGKLPCSSLEKINFPFTVTSNEAMVKQKKI